MHEAGAHVVAAFGLCDDLDGGAGCGQARRQPRGEGVEPRLVLAGRLLRDEFADRGEDVGLMLAKVFLQVCGCHG